jgi:hypothetical protein
LWSRISERSANLFNDNGLTYWTVNKPYFKKYDIWFLNVKTQQKWNLILFIKTFHFILSQSSLKIVKISSSLSEMQVVSRFFEHPFIIATKIVFAILVRRYHDCACRCLMTKERKDYNVAKKSALEKIIN